MVPFLTSIAIDTPNVMTHRWKLKLMWNWKSAPCYSAWTVQRPLNAQNVFFQTVWKASFHATLTIDFSHAPIRDMRAMNRATLTYGKMLSTRVRICNEGEGKSVC